MTVHQRKRRDCATRHPPRSADLPLDGVGFLAFTALLGGNVGAHGRVQARGVPAARSTPRWSHERGSSRRPPPRDGARSRGPREVRRELGARDLPSARRCRDPSAPADGPSSGTFSTMRRTPRRRALVTMASPADLRAFAGGIRQGAAGQRESACSTMRRHDVPAGEVGELYTRNKMLVTGTHNDAESTRKSMKDGSSASRARAQGPRWGGGGGPRGCLHSRDASCDMNHLRGVNRATPPKVRERSRLEANTEGTEGYAGGCLARESRIGGERRAALRRI